MIALTPIGRQGSAIKTQNLSISWVRSDCKKACYVVGGNKAHSVLKVIRKCGLRVLSQSRIHASRKGFLSDDFTHSEIEMMLKTKMICAVALIAMMAVPAIAEEAVKEKKGKEKRGGSGQVAKMLIKQLEPVGLTEEQTAKITELGKTASTQMNDLRKSAEITPEVSKKIREAQKSMRESDKKGKERVEAINEAAGLTESQVTAIGKIKKIQTSFHKEVIAMLTPEQKENLPRRLKRAGGAGKGKGKKKKNQEEA